MGLVRNFGKRCSVAGCKNKRLRHPEICPTHFIRLKRWGSVRADLPVKFLKYPRATIKTLTYRSWAMMKNRCTNPRSQDWKQYGGRGIKVCARWHDFRNFLADMGRRPRRSRTLDRIDNAKGYTPGNCRWATKKQQRNNQRAVS